MAFFCKKKEIGPDFLVYSFLFACILNKFAVK